MKKVSACQPGSKSGRGHDAARSLYLTASNLKSAGDPVFRTPEARDYSYLLDMKPEVLTWETFSEPLVDEDFGTGETRNVDFLVKTTACLLFVEVFPGEPSYPYWIGGAAMDRGGLYHPVAYRDLYAGYKLRNAKDLLRYCRYRVPLGDRVRLLAAVDEAGSLTLAECMAEVRESSPMSAVASMIVHNFLEVDLNAGPIGPETPVRRSISGGR